MTFLSYSCFCCACDFGHKFWAEFWVVILVNGHVHNSLMMLVIILLLYGYYIGHDFWGQCHVFIHRFRSGLSSCFSRRHCQDVLGQDFLGRFVVRIFFGGGSYRGSYFWGLFGQLLSHGHWSQDFMIMTRSVLVC